ncbi:hypothetical protein SI65_06780 [Aspergillus cristatus]|uniref:YMC020W-like alpha/beta hydrolase domain-containing protein n=1 Tax=Aspergillus cristatus TaxID=573508 RepID=A0A1E3BAJ9_ASPCR|nr:hypothetical protein SI65_06780 [Aspergillus cristatus]
MAPTGFRKKVEPSPPGTAPSTPTPSHGDLSPSSGRQRSTSSQKGGSGVNRYPGTWPAGSRASKAAPVTEVARESISAKNVANVASSSTSHLHLDDHPKHNRNPSLQLTRRQGASSRSLPANATTTRVNIASDGSTSTPAANTPSDPAAQPTDKDQPSDKGEKVVDDAAKEQPDSVTETTAPNAYDESAESDSKTAPATQTGGWFSWLYRSSPSVTDTTGGSQATETPLENPPPEPPTTDQTLKKDTVETNNRIPEEQATTKPNTPETTQVTAAPQRLSWFQMWYGSPSSSKAPEEPKKEEEPAKDLPPSIAEEPVEAAQHDTSVPDERPEERSDSPKPPAQNSRSSGWSFWFRDTSKDAAQPKTQDVEAIEGSINQDTSSQQSKGEHKAEPEQEVEIKKKGSTKVKPPKNNAGPPVLPDKVAAQVELAADAVPPKAPQTAASRNLQKNIPNQVLPRFQDTFSMQESPSLLQTLGSFLHYGKKQHNKHAYRIRDPPRIRKALAIGVHGYFPAPLIRSVLGQPTGTSVRFSTMAANAIKNWAESRGYSCDIGKIALEGEGRISERVDLLWKLLLNWMEEIRSADYIMVACHSQGVPVSIMLVAKLIAFGCVNASRVGICAMAGVNLGPFPDYRSRWISGSAGELFEFALPHSQVSQDYEAALRCALDFGVRISYIGSIDDQLVSLESSLFSPVNHPYIYRAVFVDGRVHAPSFLSHLVGFSLKLRNLGIADHGLIRELSAPLAGSLYTGEGHSRLYDDEAVYSLAITFALETSDVSGATLQIKRPQGSPVANPYILPFAMRGLLEEEHVKRELYEETMELLKQFDDWKPSSKVLKDVKFRLEGIRSKL